MRESFTTDDLTESQWQIAHSMSQSLVKAEVDVNELGKAIAYLRYTISQDLTNAGSRFFDYLETLVRNARTIGHSGKTLDYYRSLNQVCGSSFSSYKDNGRIMLEILGWVARLMRYYKNAGEVGDVRSIAESSTITPQLSERQKTLEAIAEAEDFQVGQVLEAQVKNIKGKAVTYEFAGGFKLTLKEAKNYDKLKLWIDKTVKVEITQMRENGKPKKVKWLGQEQEC